MRYAIYGVNKRKDVAPYANPRTQSNIYTVYVYACQTSRLYKVGNMPKYIVPVVLEMRNGVPPHTVTTVVTENLEFSKRWEAADVFLTLSRLMETKEPTPYDLRVLDSIKVKYFKDVFNRLNRHNQTTEIIAVCRVREVA